MDKGLKTWSSLILAGSILALASGAAQALSWHDQPIMGSFVDASVPGQFTVTVDGNPVLIPDGNTLPSQSIFKIHPTVWDGTHWFDPSVYAWAASSVNVDLTSNYTYQGTWAFLGNGPNPAYSFNFPTDIWLGSWGFTIAELYSSVGQFWLEDAGNWQYTETWTGTAGPDQGMSITSTRDFEVTVPEPASLALLALGLAGLGFSRRGKQI